MAWGRFGLRTRLIIIIAVIILSVMLIAGYSAISAFDTAMEAEAERAIEVNMNVAQAALEDEQTDLGRTVREVAVDPAYGAVSDAVSLSSQLRASNRVAGSTYLAVVSQGGDVIAVSTLLPAYATEWEMLRTLAATPEEKSFVAVVPQDELDRIGMAASYTLEPNPTEEGTLVEGEELGALSVVAVAPIQTLDTQGLLVAVQTLKLDEEFVDAIVARAGGSAAVYQFGLSAATTIDDADGARSIGEVVSDQVRRATLEQGESYRGRDVVANQDFLTAYEAIMDPDGQIVGMMHVGLPLDGYSSVTAGFAARYTMIMLLALGIAILVAGPIARQLTRPLTDVNEAAERVATGDLTVEVPATGYPESRALGESFNAMIGGLRDIIATVEESATGLSSVAAEISAASRNSAEQASRQASSVAETTATVEQLSRTFNAVAEGAGRVLMIAEDSLEAAQGGRETIDQGAREMGDLTAGAEEVRQASAAMTEVAHEITEMTGIIGSIAEQTKILAMNAAIEAARAGEAGKGFGVVAVEIRTLADTVGSSAGTISELVSGIQNASNVLADIALRQSDLTEETAKRSGSTRDAFDSILEQMEATAAAAREIASAAAEQKSAADQIVNAMQQVSVSSNETASASRQLAEASGEVDAESDRLLRGLGGFTTKK